MRFPFFDGVMWFILKVQIQYSSTPIKHERNHDELRSYDDQKERRITNHQDFLKEAHHALQHPYEELL